MARDLWGTDSLIATHRIGNIDITCEFFPGLKSDNKGTVGSQNNKQYLDNFQKISRILFDWVRVMHLLIQLLYKSTLFNLTFLTMKIQTFVKEIKEKKMRFQLNNSFILISQLSRKASSKLHNSPHNNKESPRRWVRVWKSEEDFSLLTSDCPPHPLILNSAFMHKSHVL